jgi:hypothetical protein
MANELLKTMARIEGCCCVHAFLQHYGVDGKETMSEQCAVAIAMRLGVSFKSVYRYNKRIREGQYAPCDNCKST